MPPPPAPSPRLDSFLAILLVLASVVSRVAPHPWNLTPLVAIGLVSGAVLPRAPWALAVTLAALALGDLALGYFPYEGMGWVYGAVCGVVLVGRALRGRPGVAPTVVAALASGALFYVVSNFGVWVSGQLYPHTAEGLAACYMAAIPFYRHQVAGDLVYTSLLFGALALARRMMPRGAVAPAR
jgi:hypothetical protein